MKILFSGGGTAGHINPAVAIARAVSEKEDCEAAFVGTDEGLESELIPRLGYKLYKIKVHGFERSLKPSNIKNLLELPKSINDSKKIIKDFKPDIVVGTGGYVAGPVLYAAAKLKIPTLIHESNAYPGITTKNTFKICRYRGSWRRECERVFGKRQADSLQRQSRASVDTFGERVRGEKASRIG